MYHLYLHQIHYTLIILQLSSRMTIYSHHIQLHLRGHQHLYQHLSIWNIVVFIQLPLPRQPVSVVFVELYWKWNMIKVLTRIWRRRPLNWLQLQNHNGPQQKSSVLRDFLKAALWWGWIRGRQKRWWLPSWATGCRGIHISINITHLDFIIITNKFRYYIVYISIPCH